MRKIHVGIEDELLKRALPIIAANHNGSINHYIRILIMNDLIKNGVLTDSEKRILQAN